MSTLEYPIGTLGVPREYPSCRCTRARTAAHRRRRGELPGVWVPQEYPVSTPWLGVPFEYPVRTRYARPYSECAQHCRALPTHLSDEYGRKHPKHFRRSCEYPF